MLGIQAPTVLPFASFFFLLLEYLKQIFQLSFGMIFFFPIPEQQSLFISDLQIQIVQLFLVQDVGEFTSRLNIPVW